MTTVTGGKQHFDRRPPIKWTKRQKEVLDLLVKGYTNRQIGEALGISLDGAKWHVSEIIGTLGVDTREEAADYWREYNGLPARLRRVGAALTGGLALRWAAAVAGVVVLAVVAGVVWVTLREAGGDEAAGTPAATTTAVAAIPPATPPPGPADPGGGGSDTLLILPPTPPLADTVFYTVTGCYQCDGPDVELVRHVVDGNGNMVSEVVFGPGHPSAGGLTPRTYGVSPYGTTFAVSVCDQEYCGGEMFGYYDTTWFYVLVSRDGGISWQSAFEHYGGFVSVVDVADTGDVLLSVETPVQSGAAGPTQLYVLRGSDAHLLERPSEGAWPRFAQGQVAWLDFEQNRITDSNGNVLLAPDLDPDARMTAAASLPGNQWVVSWTQLNSSQTPGQYVGIFRADGSIERYWVQEPTLRFNVIRDHEFVFANISMSDPAGQTYMTPALWKLISGGVRPIEHAFFEQNLGRNRFVAFMSGPHLRVANTGDCLNVREQPGTSAPVIACYHDGVLLRDRGESREADGATWLAVATPDGRPGWASAEFLER